MIYYLEDDKNIRELTVYALTQSGLKAQGFATFAAFHQACAKQVPEVILLDIMLTDADGLEVLASIRKSPSLANVPVMMLTAKDTEFDKVCALDGGADDYLSKPFGMLEMVSRVRALMRRSGQGQSGTDKANEFLQVGDVKLFPDKRKIEAAGQPVVLTMREFDLLEFLMRSPGQVFSRKTILLQVWGWDFVGGSRTVDVHIQQIRSKLGKSGDIIETVRGVGYSIHD